MNNRIKALYLLTITGIVIFICAEGCWLKERYNTVAAVTQFDLYVKVTQMFNEDYNRREAKLDTLEYPKQLATVNQKVSQEKLTEAMKKLATARMFPLQTDSMAQTIGSTFGCQPQVRIEVTDSIVWNSKPLLSTALINPKLKVIYPYNPLDKEIAVAEIPVPFDATVKVMAKTLLLALIVAVMLVFCLVYQMVTIRQQQKVADMQKSFTLTMLHELKRPLGALKLFISFIRSEKLDAADREEALANASREIENLSSYFNKLRAITYNEAAEVPLLLSTFNLKEAVEESAAMISGAAVTMNGADGTLLVAERQSIVNVLCNLIENAVKYSDKDMPIDISWTVRENVVEISVADRGRGIPDTDKQRIFEQFYRGVTGQDIPGMGLGLTYVRQIVTAHGGTISVKDRDGGGTIFTINIPDES